MKPENIRAKLDAILHSKELNNAAKTGSATRPYPA